MPNTTASAGPAAATAATVSWLHAYPPLLILASAAMAQPAGRLLSVGAVCSVWLRVSPILCALDALSVLARCLVYCVLLRATPWQALVLIGTDRFADDAGTAVAAAASATERGTTSRIAAVAKAATTTAIRLAGFALGVVPLVELVWFEPGGREARWTAAWAWLYVGSYVFLEAAAAVYRWEQAQPQYTAADFELDEVEADEVAQEAAAVTAGSGTEGVPYDGVPSRDATARASQEGTVVGDDDDDDDDDNPVDDAETADLLIRGGDRSDTAAAAAPADAADAAAAATPADVEAATPRPYEYNSDPSSHPRLPGIHTAFAHGESYVIGLGVLAHAVIVYWVFLDLVQPPINAHILQVDNTTSDGWQFVSGWATPLYYISLPFTFAAMLLIMAITLGSGALVVIALLGVAKAVIAQLPASVTGWARGLVPAAITVGMAGLGGLATVVAFFMGSPALGGLLLSSHSMWIYAMLSVEIVLLVLYLFASFLLYVVVRQCAILIKTRYGEPPSATEQEPAPTSSSTSTSRFDRRLSRTTSVFPAPAADAPRWAAGLLPYTTDDSAGLLAVALHTLVLSLVWYAVRFAVSGHWARHWADALVANATMVHNGTNATTNAAFSVSSVVASSTPVSTPVQLF
ncbi:hypothetical protein SPBR_03657 [Sporothrix brasiliensis 5110]|uniref:Uncharacterized protein n=1 Tax=Sporothrix brasiliensis 5110 TaxID=1398154 RepID=A0A0C2FV25_9PEZI|nr:uncharacterized protein SPBR_03657 [Sporothrix brasiliensis 5110]KIH94898.1 hypothetical protein SPBR_03657 [Sporothrix brasiliensis 5110]